MKRAFIFFLALVMIFVAGCSTANKNPFTAENAKKGQIGDLLYAVPENAVLTDESSDYSRTYKIPIENSSEEYELLISCVPLETDEQYNAVIQMWEVLRESAAKAGKEHAEEGALYEEEKLTEFLGKTTKYGVKMCIGSNEKKNIVVYVSTGLKCYTLQYTVKTSFYNQDVWNNFYAQLKLV